MSEINTGGPAFPGPYMNDQGYMEVMVKQQGMTMRDYFAAKAMQAMMSSPELMVVVTADQVLGDDAKQRISNLSYKYADAMLEARQK